MNSTQFGTTGFVNLAIHIAAAIVLMELLRVTLLRDRAGGIPSGHALPLSLAVAIIWAVHPLQTQSVTYLYQRYESLMGLFFLLSVYCFARGVDSARPRPWHVASVACWLLALGSKETAAVVPAIILWYDRALASSSWRETFRRRWGLYAFFGTLLLGGATAVWFQRAWYAGGGLLAFDQVTPLQYARSQPGVVLHYLRLVFWPLGQCVDYAWPIASTPAAILGPLVPLTILAGVTVWSVFRQPAWSFLGGWFFLTLAPTSSFAPIVDLAFEHRMYLPSAAVIAAAVFAVYGLLMRSRSWTSAASSARRNLSVRVVTIVVVALGATTLARNTVYRDEVTFWGDIARKAPHNSRSQVNFAAALTTVGRYEEAAEHSRLAIQRSPNSVKAYNNLGLAYAKLGRNDLAAAAYHEALRLDPRAAETHLNLGNVLRSTDPGAAIAQYRAALKQRPQYVDAHNNLGNLLQKSAPAEAERHYLAALAFDPTHVDAHNNLANLLARQGRFTEALRHYRTALRVNPTFRPARKNMQIVTQIMNDRSRPEN